MFLLQAKKDDEKNTEKSNDTSISEQLKVGPIVISSQILCCPLANSSCFYLLFPLHHFIKNHNKLRHLNQTSLLVLQMYLGLHSSDCSPQLMEGA